MNSPKDFKKVVEITIDRARYKELLLHEYERTSRKIESCPCGGSCSFSNFHKHTQTIRHQSYLRNLKLLGKPF